MESLVPVLPVLAVLVPAAGALLIICTGQRHANLREFWSVAAGVVMSALIAWMTPTALAGGTKECGFQVLPAISQFYSGFRLGFRADAFGVLFGLGASLLWILTSIYSIGYMRSLNEHAQTRYFACFALALSATAGVAFSANLFTMFLFYEALTLVTYPLVAHHETPEAKAGARKYVIYLLGAAKVFLMPAIILTYNAVGTLDFRAGGIHAGDERRQYTSEIMQQPELLLVIFALFLYGFAKNALMPLHSWLPAAMVAPAPVSALLHAVAVVKTGVFCTLRVFLFVIGPVAMREIQADQLALVVAAVTIVVGSLLALGQDNLKARLAFSTVSQLSYIILGAALLNRSGVVGGIAHITNHAVSKITLFLCAGSIYVTAHKTNISQLSGLARRLPWTMGALALASLSVIGIPGTSGCISKWFFALGAAEIDSFVVLSVLMLSSLLSAAYLGPIVYKAYFEAGPEPDANIREVPWIVVPLVISAAASLLLGLFPDPVLILAESTADTIFPTGSDTP
jgi:multicomponent Na+:H+ antiporter subunit D